MQELLENTTLIFWGAITLICVVPTITAAYYKIRKAEIDAALKRDMIARGMSAEEIVMVLGETKGTGCGGRKE